MEKEKKNELAEWTAYGFSAAQLTTIKNTVARGATAPELHLFLSVAKATGLNPFLRQIYFVKRNTKNGPVVSIQTGIDGYRAMADMSGRYGGNDEPTFVFTNPDDRFPFSATSTVYRIVEVGGKNERVPITRTAYWDEYYPENEKDGFMWRKMPRTMLGKCAEALALRAAFPMNLSGMYVHEEMEQVGAGPRIVEADVISQEQSAGALELNAAVEEQKSTDSAWDEGPGSYTLKLGEEKAA